MAVPPSTPYEQFYVDLQILNIAALIVIGQGQTVPAAVTAAKFIYDEAWPLI